jgi:branched-subunit amino acid transport protein AzlD
LDAPEAGGNTWWANFRIIHGALYMCAAIYCFKGDSTASLPLTIDVIFGFILFIYHHFLSKCFIQPN